MAFTLVLTILGASLVLANKCTNAQQKSQASAFCSSFESVGVTTRTLYTAHTREPTECCLPCARGVKETGHVEMVKARHFPGYFGPMSSTLATTFSPVPTPSCLGSQSISKECSKLSLRSSTITHTYGATYTMRGPLYISAQSFYLSRPTAVTKYPRIWFSSVPLPHGNAAIKLVGDKDKATGFYLGDDGYLFDAYPPTVPLAIHKAPPGRAAVYHYPVLRVNNTPPGSPQYNPLHCRDPGYDGCTIACDQNGYPDMSDSNTASNLRCNDFWNLGYNRSEPESNQVAPSGCERIVPYAPGTDPVQSSSGTA